MLVGLAQLGEVRRRVAKVRREAGSLGEEQHLGRAWLAEKLRKLIVEGLVGGVREAEVIHVERERTVSLLPDQLPHFVNVTRLAIGRHAHYFVFALVDLKAEECGERAVEQAEGMREIHLLAQFDVVAFADAPGPGHPFAHAVHREDCGLVKWRAQIRAGCVRHVVLGIKDAVARDFQVRRDLGADPQFVDHPRNHGLAEDFVGEGIGLQHRHQDAVEFAEGLLVEDGVIHVLALDPATLQAEPDGVGGIAEVMLDAAEAFLLRGSDQFAVLQQSRSSVMVIAGNPQDIHVTFCPSLLSLGGGPRSGHWAWEGGQTTAPAASWCAANRRRSGPAVQRA